MQYVSYEAWNNSNRLLCLRVDANPPVAALALFACGAVAEEEAAEHSSNLEEMGFDLSDVPLGLSVWEGRWLPVPPDHEGVSDDCRPEGKFRELEMDELKQVLKGESPWEKVDGGKIVDELRSPEGYERIMSDMFGGSFDLLAGKLMWVVVSVNYEIGAGETVEVDSLPMECEFQLDYVVVSPETTYDLGSRPPRSTVPLVFFHHEQIVPDIWCEGAGKKFPASLILCPESAMVQQMDFYPKRLYKPGESIRVGRFENVDASPRLLRAGLVGKAVDRRDEFPKQAEMARISLRIRQEASSLFAPLEPCPECKRPLPVPFEDNYQHWDGCSTGEREKTNSPDGDKNMSRSKS